MHVMDTKMPQVCDPSKWTWSQKYRNPQQSSSHSCISAIRNTRLNRTSYDQWTRHLKTNMTWVALSVHFLCYDFVMSFLHTKNGIFLTCFLRGGEGSPPSSDSDDEARVTTEAPGLQCYLPIWCKPHNVRKKLRKYWKNFSWSGSCLPCFSHDVTGNWSQSSRLWRVPV